MTYILPENHYLSDRKKKFFEISNHLGNVLTVVSDQVLGTDNGIGQIDHYQASIASASDYYPFGMTQYNRTMTSDDYRYGFNGKEKDGDLTGNEDLLALDYGFRIYNPAIGRFLSVDPLTREFAFYSPYQYAGNSPIANIDLDGAEPISSITRGEDGFIYMVDENWIKKSATPLAPGTTQRHIREILRNRSMQTGTGYGLSVNNGGFGLGDYATDISEFAAIGMGAPLMAATSGYTGLARAAHLAINNFSLKEFAAGVIFEGIGSGFAGDLGSFDVADAVIGGFGFVPSLLTGSLFDFQVDGTVASFGGVLGESKLFEEVALEASIGLLGLGLEKGLSKYGAGLLESGNLKIESGDRLNDLATRIWGNSAKNGRGIADRLKVRSLYSKASNLITDGGYLQNAGKLLDSSSSTVNQLFTKTVQKNLSK